MQRIKLSHGESHIVVDAGGFQGAFRVSFSNNVAFDLDVPGMESRRRGDELAVRNLNRTSEVVLRPRGEFFPDRTTAYVSLLLRGVSRAHDKELEFPAFDVSNLAACTLGMLSLSGETSSDLRVEVAESTEEVELDSAASGVRSALRTSMGMDNLPESNRVDVLIMVDVSASMARTVPPEAFSAMCKFASGVLSVNKGTTRLRTSSVSAVEEVLKDVTEVAELPTRGFLFNEAGWGVNMEQLSPGQSLLILSDDYPAALTSYAGRAHLLTTRVPLAGMRDGTSRSGEDPSTISYTLFDATMIQAVHDGRTEYLKQPTNAMLKTLTGQTTGDRYQ